MLETNRVIYSRPGITLEVISSTFESKGSLGYQFKLTQGYKEETLGLSEFDCVDFKMGTNGLFKVRAIIIAFNEHRGFILDPATFPIVEEPDTEQPTGNNISMFVLGLILMVILCYVAC